MDCRWLRTLWFLLCSVHHSRSMTWRAVPRVGASPPPLREVSMLSHQVPVNASANISEVVVFGGNTGHALNAEIYTMRADQLLWTKVRRGRGKPCVCLLRMPCLPAPSARTRTRPFAWHPDRGVRACHRCR